MNKNSCPSCGQEIPTDRINITEGVGLCNACGTLSRLAEIVKPGEEVREAGDESVLQNPPPGCAIEDHGSEVIVRASTRSVARAMGALALAAFWNSGVSLFVLIAIAGLYTNITGQPIPSWFPAPQAGNSPGSIGAGMPLGMTLFLCVFLIPFVLIGALIIGAVLLSLFGRNEVRLRGDEGAVNTAIGPFSWTRRFNASKAMRVTMAPANWKQNNSSMVICIEADRVIRFGSGLPDERRSWMCRALHQLLVVPASAARPALSHR